MTDKPEPPPLRSFTIHATDDPTGLASSQYRVTEADFEKIRKRVRKLRGRQPASGIDVVFVFGRPGRRFCRRPGIARAVMTAADLEALRVQAEGMDR